MRRRNFESFEEYQERRREENDLAKKKGNPRFFWVASRMYKDEDTGDIKKSKGVTFQRSKKTIKEVRGNADSD